MIDELKRLIKNRRKIFLKLCQANNLLLNYRSNKNEIEILKSIFQDREYSDYFPFYKEVIIIDIGAHFGFFSIFAKNNTDKNSIIFAIEPTKNNFNQLEKNIKDCKISDIKCFNHAIGGQNGLSRLYQGQTPNHSIVEDYSLLKQDKGFEEVETKTLEKFIIENNIEKIDFLKMDCEGAEYSIFENTPKYIFDRITTMSIEFHDLKDNNNTGEGICKILIRNDFEIVKYKYDKTSMNLNYGKIIGTKIFNSFRVNNL